jgi:hypothetical protein
MLRQARKDLVINLIKTQYSFLAFIDHTIGLAPLRTLPFKGDNWSGCSRIARFGSAYFVVARGRKAPPAVSIARSAR